jgi:hypothetical protein
MTLAIGITAGFLAGIVFTLAALIWAAHEEEPKRGKFGDPQL